MIPDWALVLLIVGPIVALGVFLLRRREVDDEDD